MDDQHQRALTERFQSRGLFSLRLSFPCLPSAAGAIVEAIVCHLRVHGRGFDAGETQALAETVRAQLEEGYSASPLATLLVEMANDAQQPHKIRFAMRPEIADGYANWEAAREFGDTPDLKVLALAKPGMRVLDVGAGTGRNAVALRDRGCVVDAIERDANFFARLNARMPAIHGDFFDHPLPGGYDLILFSEVLSSHAGSPDALAHWLTRAKGLLAADGRVLASIFAADHFDVTDQLRELGAHLLTCVFTRAEIAGATKAAGLALVSDEAVVDVERRNAAVWPEWFEAWARGQNLLGVEQPPFSLRWLTLA